MKKNIIQILLIMVGILFLSNNAISSETEITEDVCLDNPAQGKLYDRGHAIIVYDASGEKIGMTTAGRKTEKVCYLFIYKEDGSTIQIDLASIDVADTAASLGITLPLSLEYELAPDLAIRFNALQEQITQLASSDMLPSDTDFVLMQTIPLSKFMFWEKRGGLAKKSISMDTSIKKASYFQPDGTKVGDIQVLHIPEHGRSGRTQLRVPAEYVYFINGKLAGYVELYTDN